MKKSRLFSLLSIVTLICIFAIAATCNLCGVPVSVGNTSDTVNDTSDKTEPTDSSAETSNNTIPEKTDDTKITISPDKSSENEKENRSPVIEDITFSSTTIETYKYYYVTAIATDPDGDSLAYKWTTSLGIIKNDSVNPMIWTATNAAGEYTIEVLVTDGKGGQSTKSKTFTVAPSNLPVFPNITAEGGHMEKGGAVNAGDALYAGDSLANKQCFGFISFDITSLAGLPSANIQGVAADFSLSYLHGDPSFFAALVLDEYYWGDRIIKSSDAEAAGNVLQTILLSQSTFSCNNDTLENALKDAIDAGRPRFQMRIYFTGIESDEDGQLDGWVYKQSDVKLYIGYIPVS